MIQYLYWIKYPNNTNRYSNSADTVRKEVEKNKKFKPVLYTHDPFHPKAQRDEVGSWVEIVFTTDGKEKRKDLTI